MGAELWSQHAYTDGEEDRVVLYVNLTARKAGKTIFDQSYFIDDSGSGRDTSMARLVSWPATFAVEAVADGRVKPGVTAAPREPAEMNAWLENLAASGVVIHKG